jgi:hypothetical protein
MKVIVSCTDHRLIGESALLLLLDSLLSRNGSVVNCNIFIASEVIEIYIIKYDELRREINCDAILRISSSLLLNDSLHRLVSFNTVNLL